MALNIPSPVQQPLPLDPYDAVGSYGQGRLPEGFLSGGGAPTRPVQIPGSNIPALPPGSSPRQMAGYEQMMEARAGTAGTQPRPMPRAGQRPGGFTRTDIDALRTRAMGNTPRYGQAVGPNPPTATGPAGAGVMGSGGAGASTAQAAASARAQSLPLNQRMPADRSIFRPGSVSATPSPGQAAMGAGRAFVTRGILPAVAGGAVRYGANELGMSPQMSSSLGAGTQFGGMIGGVPGAAVGAAGVGAGDLGGRTITGQLEDYYNAPIADDTSMSRGDFLRMADDFADLGPLEGPSDWMLNNLLSGERGMGDLPVIGGWFGGGGDDEAQAQAEAEARAAEQRMRQLSSPDALRDTMSIFNLPTEVQATALDQLEQDIAYQQALQERGMGSFVKDAEGNILPATDIDPEANPEDYSALSPDELRMVMGNQFLQSLPELAAVEQQRQEQLNRAAAFQAMMGAELQPYIDRTQSIADMYAASGQPGMVAPILEQMNAQEGVIRMIPTMAAMDEQIARQQQIDQLNAQLQLEQLRAEMEGQVAGEEAAPLEGS